jgi:hypothetical protein
LPEGICAMPSCARIFGEGGLCPDVRFTRLMPRISA